MTQIIYATFDGQVLRPEETVQLESNKRYRITVEEDSPAGPEAHGAYPLSEILGLAADLGVTDLSERHDAYARRR